MRIGFCLLIATAVLRVSLTLLESRGVADDWPQWRGPNRDGHSTEKGIEADWSKNPPKLDWMVEGMGQGYASMSIVDGRLYTSGNTGGGQSVIAVDAKTGKVLWSKSVTENNPKHGYDGSRTTPTVDGENLYIVSSDGRIVCLKTENGEIVWERPFSEWGGKMMSGWGFSESPLVDGDLVLCTPGAANAMIVALDKKTGKEVWKSTVPQGDAIGGGGKDGAGYSSIVVSNGGGVKQYVQLIGRGVIGVRASDGKFLWGYSKVANGTANIPTPIVDGDYVFASTGYGAGACLLKLKKKGKDEVDATEEYFLDSKTFQNHHGGMVKIGDYIYAGHQHNKGFPICLEMKSGKVKWGGNTRPEGGGSAALTAVGDSLVFRYQDGLITVMEASPKGYEIVGSFKPEYQERESWSHPVIVNGKMYLREQNKLMCYDIAG